MNRLTTAVKAMLQWLFPPKSLWKENRTPLLLCTLSGLGGSVLFLPGGPGIWLAHLILIPFLVALPRLTGPMLLWGGLIFGFLFSYLHCWWLNTLVVFHPAIPLGILLLGFILALFLLPFAYSARWALVNAPGWIAPTLVALAWTGTEYLRHFGETAFPWNLLGHTQIEGPLAQWADTGGVPFVSFLVALTNSLLAKAILQYLHYRKGPPKLIASEVAYLRSTHRDDPKSAEALAKALFQRRVTLAVLDFIWTGTALFFFFLTAMGLEQRVARNLDYRVAQRDGQTLEIGLIQPNLNQLEKVRLYDEAPISWSERQEIAQRFAQQAFSLADDLAATSPSLLIFPEALLIDPLFVFDEQAQTNLQSRARQWQAELLFGTDGWEYLTDYRARLSGGRIIPRPEDPLPIHQFPKPIWETQADGTVGGIVPFSELARFVSIYHMNPDQGLLPRVYHKVQLVPFGEHAPLLDWLPFRLAERLLWVAAFQKGTEIVPFEHQGIRLGPMICFESTFGSLARQQAQAGARVLVIMTNDAWYDPAYAKQDNNPLSLLFRLPLLGAMAAAGPDQHLIQARFRAIETRLPVVRSAMRGRSAAIMPTGRFYPNGKPLPFGTQGSLRVSLPVPSVQDILFVRKRIQGRRVVQPVEILSTTNFIRYGDWLAWLALPSLALGLLRPRRFPVSWR